MTRNEALLFELRRVKADIRRAAIARPIFKIGMVVSFLVYCVSLWMRRDLAHYLALNQNQRAFWDAAFVCSCSIGLGCGVAVPAVKHLADHFKKRKTALEAQVEATLHPQPELVVPMRRPLYSQSESPSQEPTVIQQDLHQNIAHVEQIVHPNLREAAEQAAYNAEAAALTAGNERSKQTVIKAEAATKITHLQTERMILEETARLESTKKILERVKATPVAPSLSSTTPSSIKPEVPEPVLGTSSVPPAGGQFLTSEEFRALVTSMDARHGRDPQGWVQELTDLIVRYPAQAVEIREIVMGHLKSAGIL